MAFTETHGMSRSSIYSCWENMVQRCTNPKAPNWKRYGGAGITVHPVFRSFIRFFEEIGPRPTERHSIDRIDPLKGYEPGNIKWSTPKDQELNKELGLEYPGTTLDKRRGLWTWRYQRDGKVVRQSGYATRAAAFAAKLDHMLHNDIALSRTDHTAVLQAKLIKHEETQCLI